MNLTKQAHHLIIKHCQAFKCRIGIDATCGNGNDSVFLAKYLEHILCFDIQHQAIQNTQKLLNQLRNLDKTGHIGKTELIHRSHEYLQEELTKRQLDGQVDVAMFNFGYLPKSNDLSITTKQRTSSLAFQQAIDNLSHHGIMSLLCYRGHDAGQEEFNALESMVRALNKNDWQTSYYDSAKPKSTTNTAITPLLITVQRIA